MEINLNVQWHRALYKFYDGLAQLFLRLEQRYLDDPKKFWAMSERFEKYHKKACNEFNLYMQEAKKTEGYSVI